MDTKTDMQTALDEHVAKLVAIGCADQLAVHFQSQGLKAECGDAQLCAIAVSITDALHEFIEPRHIQVSRTGVGIWRQGDSASAEFGPDIQEFIQNFDAHKYTELVNKR